MKPSVLLTLSLAVVGAGVANALCPEDTATCRSGAGFKVCFKDKDGCVLKSKTSKLKKIMSKGGSCGPCDEGEGATSRNNGGGNSGGGGGLCPAETAECSNGRGYQVCFKGDNMCLKKDAERTLSRVLQRGGTCGPCDNSTSGGGGGGGAASNSLPAECNLSCSGGAGVRMCRQKNDQLIDKVSATTPFYETSYHDLHLTISFTLPLFHFCSVSKSAKLKRG